MPDHDQLLRDYLAAAVQALADLDDTLQAYLDEGPGEEGRECAELARISLGTADSYLGAAQARHPLSPPSLSVQRRQAVQAGLSVETVAPSPRWPDDPEEERAHGCTREEYRFGWRP